MFCVSCGLAVLLSFFSELVTWPLCVFCVRQTTTQEDLEFLRNQSITVEVNMARLYNYDVIRRRNAEEAKKASEELKTAA